MNYKIYFLNLIPKDQRRSNEMFAVGPQRRRV